MAATSRAPCRSGIPTSPANLGARRPSPAPAWRSRRSSIVGRRFPGAVVTDRSALWAQPHDGYLFIASAREGTLDLPGLIVVSRKGPGAIEGDVAMGAGVHLASRPRALVDNTRSTRKRGERPAASLSRAELADWIDHLRAVDGSDRVSTYRDTAEALAETLDASPARVEMLNEVVGAALGTRDSTSGSTAMKARAAGVPFDQGRVHRFELLANHLRDVVTTHPALPADAARRATLPFWEAYFSNFIEGTEFTPDEAERIVFEGEIPYVAGDEQRAVIPTITRNDYLRALRRLSRQDRPDLLVTFLDRVRRWTTQMDWSSLATARQLLDQTNAFVDANDAEDRGLHLLDPTTDAPAITTAGSTRAYSTE